MARSAPQRPPERAAPAGAAARCGRGSQTGFRRRDTGSTTRKITPETYGNTLRAGIVRQKTAQWTSGRRGETARGGRGDLGDGIQSNAPAPDSQHVLNLATKGTSDRQLSCRTVSFYFVVGSLKLEHSLNRLSSGC